MSSMLADWIFPVLGLVHSCFLRILCGLLSRLYNEIQYNNTLNFPKGVSIDLWSSLTAVGVSAVKCGMLET